MKKRTGLNRYAIHISSLYYDERIILRRGGALIFRAPVLANQLSLIYKITTLKQKKGRKSPAFFLSAAGIDIQSLKSYN